MSSGPGVRRWTLAIAGAIVASSLLPVTADADRQAPPLAKASAPVGELDLARTIAAPQGGKITRYRQRAGGLPVLDAEVVVADPAGAAPILVADTSARVQPVDRSGAITRAGAIAAAAAATGSQRLRAPARARLGIEPHSNALVWEVSLPSARPPADYLVLIDAAGGEALRSRDLLWSATGSARVFDPNPIVTQGGYEGLSDRRDRDSELLTGLLRPVQLPRITSRRGCLRGVYVDARIGKRANSVCKRGLDFTGLTRAKSWFEAVMGYFHIDRTRAYVDSLRLSKQLRSKPQRVRANGIRDDNSYYSSMTRSMTLGTGGVDDGEDADVIVHEYGHSLQDQAVKGFGRSLAAGAIGEGFGDYLAAVMSSLVTGGSEFDACIFDWDGISYSRSGCGRRADKPIHLRKAKRRCFDEIHCLGEVWASALLELRIALGNDEEGRSIMDRVVLESNFMLSRRTGFKAAARALLAADELLYGGAHAGPIETEMVERRLCKKSGC